MAKRVVVIVSGESDRLCAPHLCRHFSEKLTVFEVRKPPGNTTLTPEQAIRLIKAAWYEALGSGVEPEKFVVLVDADTHVSNPALAAKPFEKAIEGLEDIPARKLVAVAVRHLEAWFFGHAEKLREFLKRDLGSVDASKPDEIDHPKEHLINLLTSRFRRYTPRIAEQIAKEIDPPTIEGRSPSFADFVRKIRNGAS